MTFYCIFIELIEATFLFDELGLEYLNIYVRSLKPLQSYLIQFHVFPLNLLFLLVLYYLNTKHCHMHFWPMQLQLEVITLFISKFNKSITLEVFYLEAYSFLSI